MTYPKHLFRIPGPFRQKGVDYAVAGAADEDQEADLLASGWYLTLEAAQGKTDAANVIEAAEALEDAIDEVSPATRAELEIKAKELGIRGVHLMKDATLARKIAEAV